MGVIMGTAAYMSPEQARGKSVDKRADIWSFGVVLFEMLTGQRAFQGEDVSLTLASVMKSDPYVRALPNNVPPAIRLVLHRCLEKDATQRMRDCHICHNAPSPSRTPVMGVGLLVGRNRETSPFCRHTRR